MPDCARPATSSTARSPIQIERLCSWPSAVSTDSATSMSPRRNCRMSILPPAAVSPPSTVIWPAPRNLMVWPLRRAPRSARAADARPPFSWARATRPEKKRPGSIEAGPVREHTIPRHKRLAGNAVSVSEHWPCNRLAGGSLQRAAGTAGRDP